ncbi:hypothetical protein DEU29_10159 [Idiomarina aquatica]|uniref:Uncharacterized protein n=1 Tax=Idiomarina aquatica TaxID=1327752 RepID=A0A4R6PP93_9GAMM|nr:hypothetical protein [Idiomarina aquatica]TDP40515.1 hypothetical protein DEU29_10159 [Idiomarina aquatica]
MSETTKRSTIYFDPQLHAALAEDQEDLAAFEDRVAEPTISYEALLAD